MGPIFDPEHLRQEMKITAMHLRAYSELDDKGIDFQWSPGLGVLFKKTRDGAILAAEKEPTGPIGHFLRFIRSEDYHSKNPKVRAAIEARVNLRRNKLIKKALRNKRNRKATLDAEAALVRVCDEKLALLAVLRTAMRRYPGQRRRSGIACGWN
jgi:hypothetical protein